MTISMVAAIGLDRSLGANNQLLWKLKSDLEKFRERTLFQNVVMGSITYRSIGKPLDKRNNIVLSRNKDLEVAEGVIVYDSVSKLLQDYQNKNLYVIGGEQIYKQFLPFVDHIHLTIVEGEFPQADTFFPPLPQEWKCISKYQRLKDKDNDYNHWYCVYEKVNA